MQALEKLKHANAPQICEQVARPPKKRKVNPYKVAGQSHKKWAKVRNCDYSASLNFISALRVSRKVHRGTWGMPAGTQPQQQQHKRQQQQNKNTVINGFPMMLLRLSLLLLLAKRRQLKNLCTSAPRGQATKIYKKCSALLGSCLAEMEMARQVCPASLINRSIFASLWPHITVNMLGKLKNNSNYINGNV